MAEHEDDCDCRSCRKNWNTGHDGCCDVCKKALDDHPAATPCPPKGK